MRAGCPDPRQNDVRAGRNQFRRILAKICDVADAPARVDPDVSADGPARFLHPLREGGEARLQFRLVGWRMHENADPPLAVAGLCAHGEWVSCRRAPEQRYESTPFQLVHLGWPARQGRHYASEQNTAAPRAGRTTPIVIKLSNFQVSGNAACRSNPRYHTLNG